MAEQRDGKMTALLTGLAVPGRSSRGRTAAGVAGMVLCAGAR